MNRVLKAAALITMLAVLAVAFCACNMLKVTDSPTHPDSDGGVSSSRFILSFDTDGGSAVPAIMFAAGATLVPPEDPSRTGYAFAGWFRGDEETAYEFTTMPERDFTLTAHWTANSYKISFNALGGTEVTDTEVKYDTEFSLPVSSRIGYKFVGWKAETGAALTSATGEGSSRWNTAADVELLAIWEPAEYSITYKNLSDISHDNPAKYTIETETITLQDPSFRPDYDFAGWQLANGTPITEIPQGSTGDLEIHAKWNLHDYVITYENLYGTTHTNSPTFNIESSVITLTAPTDRTGYMFDGWFDSETGGRKVTEIKPEKYRGVYFTSYRPWECCRSSSADNSYQDDNDYFKNTMYWFKYEPIKWRILSEEDGSALLLCETAIDSQQWDWDGTEGNNNYEESTIRAWLNDTFYNTAFGEEQKAHIQTTLVDNSEDTSDKVFLLSYKEATNAAYGFSESGVDTARQKKSTDYAKAQGCYADTASSCRGNCYWWLRSPYIFYSNVDGGVVRNVIHNGNFNHFSSANTDYGVVPALTISLSDTSAYKRINEDGTPDAYGDYILFGEYPQTRVTDRTLPSAPGDYALNTWTVYRYYVSSAASGFMKYSDKKHISEDKTLYAGWIPVEYSVSYELDSGTNNPANPSVYTIEDLGGPDGTISLQDPEKIAKKEAGDYLGNGLYELFVTKYTFEGWYTDNSFTTPVTALSLPLGTVTLYAKWGTDTFVTTSTVAAYQRIDADGTANSSGEYILFGEYPQTRVTDSATISALGDYASNTWTSYGYYISNTASDFMKYTDKEYGGAKYRGVYFTQYRPWYCDYSSSADKTDQDDNGYYLSTVYWFKYEPIKWRILNESGGNALILCDTAIDSQQWNFKGGSNYNNNYVGSTIRTWLNYTFYNTALNDLQQALIQTSVVDNSASSAGYDPDTFACADTNDKIFLLSYIEATNAPIGLQKKSTDYAKAQGCLASTSWGELGNCRWWLRSPDDSYDDCARYVTSDGDVYDYLSHSVYCTNIGVVPALRISL